MNQIKHSFQKFELHLLLEELHNQVSAQNELELKLNQLRSFKKKYFSQMQAAQFETGANLPEVFYNLSLVSEAILQETLKLADQELSKNYGKPSYSDNQGNVSPAQFIILGMGKLGGREIHYHSDLDLIFIFSRNGNTSGSEKTISNQEYFGRLSQKLMSFLSVHTYEGSCFKIDTQLRPSGNQGALVSSLDAFADYQKNQAQFWEKQALLKARVVAGDENFSKEISSYLKTFIFNQDLGNHLNKDIYRMRLKMEKELAQESSNRIHFKHGSGGLTDIEFAVQFLQLKMGKIYESILSTNTYESLEKLYERNILSSQERGLLKEAYLFYRSLETTLEIQFEIKNPYLNPQAPFIEDLAEKMGYSSETELVNELNDFKQEVRKIFLRILQLRA